MTVYFCSEGSEKEDGKEKPSAKDASAKGFSPESGDKRGGAGPPHLPPRLMKQQMARHEERIRRSSGGRASSPPPPPSQPPQQRPPPLSQFPPPSSRSNKAPLAPAAQDRFHDQGPRAPNPGAYRQMPYQARPPFNPRHGYPPQKRVYDPHSRGQMAPHRMLWTEDRRPHYRHDRYDMDYGQPGPNAQRRGPASRYQGGGGGGYPTYTANNNRQYRDKQPTQYSAPQQYTGPPPLYHANSKYNGEQSSNSSRSYKHGRPHAQAPPAPLANSSEPTPNDEHQVPDTADVELDEHVTQESSSSVEQESASAAESAPSSMSESSAVAAADDETLQSQEIVVTEAEAPPAAPNDGGDCEADDVTEPSEPVAQYDEVQYNDSTSTYETTAQNVATTYVYTGASEMNASAPPFVQMAPPVQQMQTMTLQSVPSSCATAAAGVHMQPYPGFSSAGVVIDAHMYAQQPYNPAVQSNIEYSTPAVSMPDPVTSPPVVMNGAKHKVSKILIPILNAIALHLHDLCVHTCISSAVLERLAWF